MTQRIFIIVSLFINSAFAQQTVGLFDNQPSAYNGYTLFNPLITSSTYLIDNCGVKVYEWTSSKGAPAAAIYLTDNGNLLRTFRPDSVSFSMGGAGGGIEILDPNSNTIWQYEINTDSTLSHHDVELLPNGNILIIALELISAQEASDHGSVAAVDRWSEMILEVDPATDQIVWEWHAWDHLIQDNDSSLLNYGVVSENPGKINVNYAYDSGDPDWLHANSIDYNPDLDQIIINIPTFGEFWIIDHNTTIAEAATDTGGFSRKGGDLLYRWGNPEAYGRADTSQKIFEYQHDAHWIKPGLLDEGKIMVFNNGDVRGYSSVDIVSPPLDTNNFNNYSLASQNLPFGPTSLDWSYSDSANFFSRRVSGAQRLKNGNTLICSGWQGNLFEIEYQTDSIVWDYIVPVNIGGPITQGASSGGNFLFRAERFSPSYSGLTNLSLTPSTVIELNPLPSNCITYVRGCMDSLACNYNPLANLDNGSCSYPSFSEQSRVICSGDSLSVGNNVYDSSGIYIDTLFDTNGCDSTIITELIVFNTYLVNNVVRKCYGDSVLINNNVYDQTGIYVDSFTTVNGCDSIITTNLTIDSEILPLISQVEDSLTAEILVGANDYAYEWSTGETTKTIAPLMNGEYWVIVSDTNNCRSDTVFYNVDWVTTSISDLLSNRINIYPNPTSRELNINFKIQRSQNTQIRIYNLLGEIVFFESLKNQKGEYRKTLDISMLSKGVYLLKVTSPNRLAERKLVIE